MAEGKEEKEFDGERYILERGIVADLSLVKAWKADKSGNLIYRKTAQNFNPVVATCGRVTVAEVEEIVEVGQLDPDSIDTPGIYVQRVVLNATPGKTHRAADPRARLKHRPRPPPERRSNDALEP